ncbi:unnamed protein product [Brassicogethes aeneus]|uniref:Uncharacterized protein n=1 Tax=Brassicogethes aeneus TaxID=1431903 RepID=A0A9P0BDQ6_BRAAE|nr:unnamed protein product [Brassicogethes aeneus]
MPIRWNSTSEMLERVLKIKEPLLATLAIVNFDKFTLTASDWKIIEHSCRALFKSRALLHHCSALQDDPDIPKEIKNMIIKMIEQLNKRFLNIQDNLTLAETTLLDPKFGFTDTKAFEKAKTAVTNAASQIVLEENAKANNTDNESKGDGSTVDHENETMSIWKDYDKKTSFVSKNENATAAGIIEMNSYAQVAGKASEKGIGGKDDPFRKEWSRIVTAANTLKGSDNAEIGALCKVIMSAQEAGMDRAIDESKVPRPSITREARMKGSQSYELFQAAESRGGWPRGKEDMTEGFLAVARERFPDLANNEEGEKVLETNTRIGNKTRRKRILVARPDAEDPTEEMYRGIVELGSIASLEGADMISFAAPAAMAGTARKMAPCVLVAGRGIKARVCIPQKTLKTVGAGRFTMTRQVSVRPRKHRHEAVLVRGTKPEEYLALLAGARKDLKGQGVKAYYGGQCGEKTEILRSDKKTALVVTNIEAALSEEEIKAAIKEQIGAAEGDIEVRDLRSGFRGKQAATVLAPPEICAAILAHEDHYGTDPCQR